MKMGKSKILLSLSLRIFHNLGFCIFVFPLHRFRLPISFLPFPEDRDSGNLGNRKETEK